METVINKIVANPVLHAKWLNTLSLMENVGARKIKNCEDPVFVNEMILKHAAEEARHAYYLKKQLTKIGQDVCPTYERKYLLASSQSTFYLNYLDVMVSRYLKSTYQFSSQELKYAAYLLVTYAIEVRADEMYPVYQDALNAAGSKVNVKSIIAEEKNHLAEMEAMLKIFSPHWEAMCEEAVRLEDLLYHKWINALEAEVEAV